MLDVWWNSGHCKDCGGGLVLLQRAHFLYKQQTSCIVKDIIVLYLWSWLVTRRGCFEGCVLLVVGAIAAAIAIPSCMTIRWSPLQDTLRGHLANSYKECAYHLARLKEDLPVRDLALTKWANKSNRWWEDESGRWKVFDLKTRSQLDLNAGCTASKVLAKPLAAHYGELAYSIDLGNGDKTCVTRTGEARDDWSCE